MHKLPTELYLAKQVKAMDCMVIEEQGTLGIHLMRKAGLAVFELIQKYHSKSAVIIFCGAGNNAGDGYVVAEELLKSGHKVIVYTLTKLKYLQNDVLIAQQNFVQIGGQIVEFSSNLKIDFNNRIIVDALLGTGLNREILGLYAQAIMLINNSASVVIAIDIPSGLSADTGWVLGCAVKADYTIVFVGLKQGMFTGFATEYCGNIFYVSLGVGYKILQKFKPSARLLTDYYVPKRCRYIHKGNNGHVLVIGGYVGFSGAVRLAAEAALRIGAGLVSVATHAYHANSINSTRPELMCHGIECASQLIPLLNQATVVVLGPGLGTNSWGLSLFKQALKTNKPLIIDADGINFLASSYLSRVNWVLTPHPGEAARLLQCTTLDIAKNRFVAIAKIQKKYAGIALLKGAGTLIDDGNEISISITGNPGMASGGMGDTLAGIIAGLVAQNMPLHAATKSAAYLHGKAADLAAQQNGEIGLLASDLMPYIRQLANQ